MKVLALCDLCDLEISLGGKLKKMSHPLRLIRFALFHYFSMHLFVFRICDVILWPKIFTFTVLTFHLCNGERSVFWVTVMLLTKIKRQFWICQQHISFQTSVTESFFGNSVIFGLPWFLWFLIIWHFC